MDFSPITMNGKVQNYTQQWRGLNHSERCGEGELYDMKNMTGDCFPVLATRKSRGMVMAFQGRVVSILTKSGIGTFYAVWGPTGETEIWFGGRKLDELEIPATKRDRAMLVSMGAYVILFPHGVWFSCAGWTEDYIPESFEHGSIDNTVSHRNTASDPCVVSLCDREGNAYQYVKGTTAPTDHDKIWIDTAGGEEHGKRWDTIATTWVIIPQVYTKIQASGIGVGFKQGDGVQVTGPAGEIGGWSILTKVEDNTIILPLLYSEPMTFQAGVTVVERKHPKLNYVVECNNRLWGCYYGQEDGEVLNEIYACALGDFKNWNKFQGTSMDSYAASRGSDGAWTGAITYQGKPTFFKENCIETVYVSSSGAHEIVTNQVKGCQRAAYGNGSLAVVGELLYYYTGRDVVAYDGSTTTKVSAAWGQSRFDTACAGACGRKYYINCVSYDVLLPEGQEQTATYVYDTTLGTWFKEGEEEFTVMGGDGDVLYMADTRNMVWVPEMRYAEVPFDWMAETGDYGLVTPNRTYLSRFVLRLMLEKDAWCDVWVMYDSTEQWEHIRHIEHADWLQSRQISYIPKRCDHMRIRITGHGGAKIYALGTQTKEGSDLTI